MVSQGDITPLQRITQPGAQSQSLSGSAGSACGRRGTAHCTRTGPPFRGNGLLSPPRSDREFCDENANSRERSVILFQVSRTGSSHIKPTCSYIVANMECLPASNCKVYMCLFEHYSSTKGFTKSGPQYTKLSKTFGSRSTMFKVDIVMSLD